MYIMTVLHMHGDREHESINVIDSLTQPSEHACFDLAKHYSSYNVPYRAYIMYACRNELVGVIRMLRTCRSR